MSTTLRRYAAALVGGALVAGGLAAAPAHAQHETDRTARATGATWLNDRVAGDGLLHAAYDAGSGPVSYVDYGGTVEAGYALEAAGRTRQLPTMTAALADSADSYITGADFGSPTDYYAGPTGKLLAFVTDLGGDADPAAFGGTDVVARMESLTTGSGRIEDVSAWGDYANVYGQIWAARGLLNVDSPEASAAVDFLLTQQCADGHFRSFFTDGCDTAGPDASAFAVILLSDHAAADPELAAALGDATDWLVDWQGPRGGLTDDKGVVNANSTGLGGWAFDVAGRTRAARKAAVWLRALQVPGRGCDGRLAGQRGAIAYDRAAYRAGRRKGLGALTVGQWQTVAAQALPALAIAPATHVALSVVVPDRVDAGGTARVRVFGLAQGERACVGIGTRLKSAVGGREGDAVVVRIRVPDDKGGKTVRVLTANDAASAKTTAG